MTKSATALLFLLFACCGFTCLAQESSGVPLAEAIDKLNASLDKRMSPLTEEELFLAIEQWDRDAKPISDRQIGYFRKLRESRILKTDERLYLTVSWLRDGMEGTTESLTASIQLDLMTGKRQGYGFNVRRQVFEQRPYPPTTPGYEWLVRPEPLQATTGSGNSIIYSIETEPHLSVTMSRQLDQRGMYDLQPVAFDSHGVRHTLQEQRIGQFKDMRMSKYVLRTQPEPPTEIVSLGIEMLTPVGAKYLSDQIVENAALKGKKVLPLPLLREPFTFEFASASGKPIKSSELLGNVVLIDCWASWCGPCVKHIPVLKQLHEEFTSDGLTIIGLSFDEVPKDAEAVYQSQQVPWQLVHVPEDEATRALWKQSARITSLPRIFVLNQAGILESDSNEVPIDVIRALLKKNGALDE